MSTHFCQIPQYGGQMVPALLAESESPRLQNEDYIDASQGAEQIDRLDARAEPLELVLQVTDHQAIHARMTSRMHSEFVEAESTMNPFTPRGKVDQPLSKLQVMEERPNQSSPTRVQSKAHKFHDLTEEIQYQTACAKTASEISRDSLGSTSDQFYTPCSSLPDYDFELSSTFFVEQYVTNGPLTKRLTMLSMSGLYCNGNQRVDKYFLYFAETPRCWKRVVVSAVTLVGSKEAVNMAAFSSTSSSKHAWRMFPEAVEPFLEGLGEVLSSVDLAASITRVSLCLELQDSGQLAFDPSRISIAEDVEEARFCESYKYLQDIEDMGCAQYLESEIVIYEAISSSTFRVLVESQACIEMKAKFGKFTALGYDRFQDWADDMMRLRQVSGCPGVAKFIGVVLDDTRTILKSYLQEYVGEGIPSILEEAQANSRRISWRMREKWAKQMIKTVAEIHSRGVVIPWIGLGGFSIDNKQNAILRIIGNLRWKNVRGLVPPEIRCAAAPREMLIDRQATFHTGIFQLGLALYMLAEHATTHDRIHCKKANCGIFPTYNCTAEHSNPVTLPRCGPEVPSYFSDIISACRCVDPQKRLSAASLLKLFPPTESESETEVQLPREPSLSLPDPIPVYCDECGVCITKSHFSCGISRNGEFDLCARCFTDGISSNDEAYPLEGTIL